MSHDSLNILHLSKDEGVMTYERKTMREILARQEKEREANFKKILEADIEEVCRKRREYDERIYCPGYPFDERRRYEEMRRLEELKRRAMEQPKPLILKKPRAPEPEPEPAKPEDLLNPARRVIDWK